MLWDKQRRPITHQWLEVSPSSLPFCYAVRFSKRRSAELRVSEGKVKVYAPATMPMQAIASWVADREAWILRALDRQSVKQAEVPVRQGVAGERWPYLGELFTLAIQPARRNSVCREGDKLHVQLAAGASVGALIEAWYKAEARTVLTAKTVTLAESLGLSVHTVKLRRTKTKWGHCTRRGVIQFNWLVIQAPEWVVDYLVAHEVSHLQHPDHSRAFWRYVAAICPDYRAADRWLNENGHRLTV